MVAIYIRIEKIDRQSILLINIYVKDINRGKIWKVDYIFCQVNCMVIKSECLDDLCEAMGSKTSTSIEHGGNLEVVDSPQTLIVIYSAEEY